MSVYNQVMERIKRIYLSQKPYYIKSNVKQLAKSGFKESIKNAKTTCQTTVDYPIDFVVTWVDGNDPKWQSEKTNYLSKDNSSKTAIASERFRDWDNLQYWFRAVEQYAPWIRKIFFVTNGHVPAWLEISNPKLKIVKHTDYIPCDYLPTFNSNVIELNFWRISDLSEHFVYFNDDMFLTSPTEKAQFFCNGLPQLYAVSKPNKPKLEMTEWDYARFNNCRACNSKFDIKKVMEQNPEKWFSFKFGKEIKYNLRTYEDGFLSGMVFPHVCYRFRKSSMEACYRYLQSEFELTFSKRFRSNNDINLQIFDMWEMMHNTFESTESFGELINVTEDRLEELKVTLNNSSVNCVCINDSERINEDDFEQIKTVVNDLLRKKFPKKSSFEK